MRNSVSDLDPVAQFFDIGLIQEVKRAPGLANENYFVRTDRGEFVVKLIHEHTIVEIRQEIEFLDRLSNSKCQNCTYLRSPIGESIFSSDDVVAVVMHQMPGAAPVISEDVNRQMGQALANLHIISTDGLRPRRNWFRLSFIRDALAEIEKSAGAEAVAKYWTAYQSVSHIEDLGLRSSIIHGDFFPGNCLFFDGRLCAVLDWEEVTIGPSILDLAYTTMCCCFLNSVFDRQLFSALITGYKTRRNIGEEDVANFDLALRFVGLVVSTWTYLRYGLRNSDYNSMEWSGLYWTLGLSDWKDPGILKVS